MHRLHLCVHSSNDDVEAHLKMSLHIAHEQEAWLKVATGQLKFFQMQCLCSNHSE